MIHASLTELSPKWLSRMRAGSELRAPWAGLPEGAWHFLEHSLDAGIPWQAQARCLDRWLVPETNTERRRQQSAINPATVEMEPPFSCAIGLASRHYLGGMTGHGWDGSSESYYAPSVARLPGEYELLARVVSLFWPDMPALLWEQVRPLLAERARQTDEESFGGTSEYAVDYIDAIKLYRFLDSHAKTTIVQGLVDWKHIIDPMAPVVPPSLGVHGLRQENGVVIVG